MSDEFRTTLEAIKEAAGRIETKLDNHTEWMTQHAAEDAVMAQNIELLAQRRGITAKAWSRVGAAASVALAAVAAAFVPRGH
jgi:hypothetical protein